MAPSTQKSRPISFVLYDDAAGRVLANHDLVIRPEDLTRRDPSRLSEQQTLGGVWADDFGLGITVIDMSGHTGWRGGATLDGAQLFQQLHRDIFVGWHRERQAFADTGKNPDHIQMIVNDELNGHADVVAPRQFQLKRNKARPLLSQFSISMIVLGDVADTGKIETDSINDAILNTRGRYAAATTALSANIEKQKALALQTNAILGDIAGAANVLLSTSNKLLEKVNAVGQEVAGRFDAVTAPLLYPATVVQEAARNAFQILTVPYGITQQARYTLMQIASNFNEAYCTLRGGFNVVEGFLDIEDFFGASHCSSTGGGRPISPFANQNPFLELFEPTTSAVSISPLAVNALTFLQRDVQAVTNTVNIPLAMERVGQGVTLS